MTVHVTTDSVLLAAQLAGRCAAMRDAIDGETYERIESDVDTLVRRILEREMCGEGVDWYETKLSRRDVAQVFERSYAHECKTIIRKRGQR